MAVGHVTIDRLGQRDQPGGGAFYSALQAARMGLRALVVTRASPRELEPLIDRFRCELHFEIQPAEHATTLATSGDGPERRQRLLAWAGPVSPPRVHTRILHLAPVARELTGGLEGRADFIGLTPQGLLRRLVEGSPLELGEPDPGMLPARVDAVVLNERELGHFGSAAASRWRDQPLLAVTAGASPALLHPPGQETVAIEIPAVGLPHDDLGAGDVFAAVLFVSLLEGLPAAEAGARAAAAAALRLQGQGPDAIADRAAIERTAAAGRSGD